MRIKLRNLLGYCWIFAFLVYGIGHALARVPISANQKKTHPAILKKPLHQEKNTTVHSPEGVFAQVCNVAVIIYGASYDEVFVQKSLHALRYPATFVLSPHLPGLRGIIKKLEKKALSVLLALSIQPFDYPLSDPGPLLLHESCSAATRTVRLLKHIALGSGAIGVTYDMPSPSMEKIPWVAELMHTLQEKGLIFIEPVLSPTTTTDKVAQQEAFPGYGAIHYWIPEKTWDSPAHTVALVEKTAASYCILGLTAGLSTCSFINALGSALKEKGFALVPLRQLIQRQNSQKMH